MMLTEVSPDILAQAEKEPSKFRRAAYLVVDYVRQIASAAIPGEEKAVEVREGVKAKLFGGRSDDEAREWLDDEVFVFTGWREKVSDLAIRFAPQIVDRVLDFGIHMAYRALKLAGERV